MKRFAIPTEDHPLEYAGFKGIIPQGEYGAGTAMVWDQGARVPDHSDVDADLRGGELKFRLRGRKLKEPCSARVGALRAIPGSLLVTLFWVVIFETIY